MCNQSLRQYSRKHRAGYNTTEGTEVTPRRHQLPLAVAPKRSSLLIHVRTGHKWEAQYMSHEEGAFVVVYYNGTKYCR